MRFQSASQQLLFTSEGMPDGFIFQLEALTPAEEELFLSEIVQLSFGPFRMHGIEAKRRIAHFGLRYTSGSLVLTSAVSFPLALEPLREKAAKLAAISPSEFAEILVTEYQPGAGIGWHRDSHPSGS